MEYKKEKISNQLEECSCIWCGWPLYQGDHVLYYEEEPYCSEVCIRECKPIAPKKLPMANEKKDWVADGTREDW